MEFFIDENLEEDYGGVFEFLEDVPEEDGVCVFKTPSNLRGRYRNTRAGVYQISSNIDHRIYIGSSVSLNKRLYDHENDLKNGRHSNKHLQSFFNKYKNPKYCLVIKFSILEFCDKDSTFEREQFYLDKLQPFGDRGFNSRRIASPEPFVAAQKRSYRLQKSLEKTFGFCQYSLSGQFIAKYSSRMELAEKFNVEKTNFNKACNKLHSYLGYIWLYDNGDMPEQLSDEYLSSLAPKPQHPISVYTCEGELLYTFKSTVEAQKKTGFDRKAISKACKREDNRYKNLFWVFDER